MKADAALEDDVIDHLHALLFQLKSRLRTALQDDPSGLAPMELRALGYFARHPGASPRDLVEHSGRDKAQVTRLLKALQARGLLNSEVDAADRRCQRLTLTDAGREVQRRHLQQRRRLAAAAVADLSTPERTVLLELLARMRNALAR